MWTVALTLAALAAPQEPFGPFDPYHPGPGSPRLTTPQWVGEEGVEAVVVLSIDDMRAPEPYDRYLYLILNRLEAIDDRAPVSIFVNGLEPGHPTLQTWLGRGLSLEVHTTDHPCPLLQGGDLSRARSTVERCIDLLNEVPGSSPVAYRMPCCDSINSVSPRFFAEIFEGHTEAGNHLTIDSSVFNVFGDERFRQHLPADRSFVNTIEGYPYPYVIGKACWELPCAVPSDWEAQHLRGPNHPETVADMKAALDCCVEAKGVFTLVFHPHNWIQARQVVELIDHADQTYGRRVKFLNFREVQERLDATVGSLRLADGSPSGARLLDLDGDGLHDVVGPGRTRRWTGAGWEDGPFPGTGPLTFGVGPEGEARALGPAGSWRFLDGGWTECPEVAAEDALLFDLDGDGISELLRGDDVLRARDDGGWEPLGFALPVALHDDEGRDAGVRLVDLDGDGLMDLVASSERGASVHRLLSMERGWTEGGATSLPPITVEGRERGVWAHSGHLWWQNEDTASLPNHVDRRSFTQLLAALPPVPLSPEESRRALEVQGPLEVRLAAAEPLVRDPIAFDWDAAGHLYVVEMGDYPLGSEAGGRVRRLVDRDGDWRYDEATTFLDGLAFPTGVAPWRDGVLVTCAPDILFARDTSGDGVADEVSVLVTGFGEGNQQHRVNGLWWGLDNAYHGANGDSGGAVGPPGAGTLVDLSGLDFALYPDEARVVAEAGQTQFGKTRDDWGNWFGGNNYEPAWHFPLASRYLARAPHVVPPPSHLSVIPGGQEVFPRAPVPARFNDPGAARRFTSACSPTIYRGEVLPLAGDLLVCEPVHGLVHRRHLTSQGLSFMGERTGAGAEFLASTDPTFRPTMVRTGPDGALWVADMSRAVIEHPEWIPDDWEERLDLREGHDRGRLYRIVHAVVQHPMRFPSLGSSTDAELVRALKSGNGWVRDCAQRLLVERGASVAGHLTELLRAGSRPTARLHALCTLDGLGELREEDVGAALADPHPGVRRHAVRLAEPFASALLDALAPLARDPDARVRLQLACSLGACRDPRAGGLLTELLIRDGADAHARAAALSSFRAEHLSEALAAAADEGLRRELLLIAARLEGADPMALLLACKVPVVESVRHLGALLTLRPDLDPDDAADMIHIVSDPSSDGIELDVRLRILAWAGHPVTNARLVELVELGAPVSLLAERDDPEVARLFIERWRGITPARRKEVLDVLLSRRSFTDQVVVALEDGHLRPSDLGATQAGLLVEHASEALRPRARAALQHTATDRAEVVQTLGLRVAEASGEILRGREVFRTTCVRCHRLDGEGVAVGPDLRALSDRSTQALLVAILDPNRAIEARYLGYTALTHDGRLFSGVVAEETETSVTLRGAGVDEVLLRADLEGIVSTGLSQMPEGLEAELGVQDLADLLAYLQGEGLTPRALTGTEPRVVVPGEGGELVLAATDCEVFGPNLTFEARHGNLGFWSGIDDLAVWSIELGEGGTFEVEVEQASPDNPGPNVLVLGAGGQELAWTVEPTGSWDSYRRVPVGRLQLPAGRTLLTARAAQGLRGYLLDLRGVRLRPVD